MKSPLKKIFAAAIPVLLIASCKKADTPQVVTLSSDQEKIQIFFDKHRPYPQQFTLNAGTGGTISLKSGTKITFAPGSFVKKNGMLVTGTINLSAKDILKASEMIFDDKPTVALKGQLLESFGELMVTAVQDGDSLKLNPKLQEFPIVEAPIAAANGEGREAVAMWLVDTTIAVSNYGYNHENVAVTVTRNVPARKGMEWTETEGSGYCDGAKTYFPLVDIGRWINCDALYDDPSPQTTVLGYFGDAFNDRTNDNYVGTEPSMLFFKTKGTNTVVKLYNLILNPAPGKQGLLSYQNSIPVGLDGTFLAISVKNGRFYAATIDMKIPTPAAGKNYVGITFNLQEVTEAQLLTLINQMNLK